MKRPLVENEAVLATRKAAATTSATAVERAIDCTVYADAEALDRSKRAILKCWMMTFYSFILFVFFLSLSGEGGRLKFAKTSWTVSLSN